MADSCVAGMLSGFMASGDVTYVSSNTLRSGAGVLFLLRKSIEKFIKNNNL